MKRTRFLWLLILCLYGCSTVPFQKPLRVSMRGADPAEVRERFAGKVPIRYGLLNVVILKFNRFKQISALGSMTVNTADDAFTAVCINPLGVTLFEVTSDKNGIEGRFVIEPLAGKEGLAKIVAEDIRRVYYDLVPSDRAKAEKKKYKIIFEEVSGKDRMRYVFSGDGSVLTEKKYYEEDTLSYKVAYYDYRVIHGKLFPGGIVLDNYKYGYQLIVKLKEVYLYEQN